VEEDINVCHKQPGGWPKVACSKMTQEVNPTRVEMKLGTIVQTGTMVRWAILLTFALSLQAWGMKTNGMIHAEISGVSIFRSGFVKESNTSTHPLKAGSSG
jgi:hypothetical protein